MSTRWCTSWLAGLWLLLPLDSAEAHDLPDQRRLLVAAEGNTLTLLVAWEIPDGPAAAQLAAAWNLDAATEVLSPAEKLAQVQLLLPRLRRGWTLEVEHVPVVGTLKEFVVTPHAGPSLQRGYAVAATWEVGLPEDAVHLGLYAAADSPPAEAEFQVQPPWQIRVTELPRDPNGWLAGPVALDSDTPAWVELERLAQPAATDAHPLPAAPPRPPLPAAATPPKR